MPEPTQPAPVPDTTERAEEWPLAVSLAALRPEHPALARAHDSVTGRNGHDEITSYDRLHHRHNRS